MKNFSVQKFGAFITNMVMPNIGAFIAWGLITAFFIPTGWFPNPQLNELVSPILTFVLPLLIAYTGGRQVGGVRGGVVGVVAATGCIVVADIPMFLGAMILGPLAGLLMKKWDELIEGKIPAGFEMVVNNFSLGILGMILAIGAYYAVGPILQGANEVLQVGIEWLVEKGMLPLLSLVNEPAKVLFLNNAIEQGIYNPLGMQQAVEHGKSIYFMLESSPGPGLGLLLAYSMFGRGESKQSAPTAIIIHFFGGIHEIYFPYVLANPFTLLSMIFGGMSGLITFQLFNAGLVAFPSPGSIFSYLALTPRGGYIATIAGVIVGTAVSFLITSFILKVQGRNAGEEDLEASKSKVAAMKAKSKGHLLTDGDLSQVKKITFACDAGMGSSAMGASAFANKLKKAGIPIKVDNTSIENIPDDADVVVVQSRLYDRARKVKPDIKYVLIENYINDPENDKLLEKLQNAFSGTTGEVANSPYDSDEQLKLDQEAVLFDLESMSKTEAIQLAGERLVELGYVKPEYVSSMQEKETIMSTYIGNGIAIPHGTDAAKKDVLKSGIDILHFKDGIDYDGNRVYLVIGIAGVGNEHLSILAKISTVLADEAFVSELIAKESKEAFIAYFEHGEVD